MYFNVITQISKYTLSLVSLSELDASYDPVLLARKAMEEIDAIEAEVIILYTKLENIELMLQQVTSSCFAISALSSESRRLQDIAILMYKVKNDLVPSYISEIFTRKSTRYNLRNSDFEIPRFNTIYIYAMVDTHLGFKDHISGPN